jgi:DNA-binding transcriptional LysR family regulator
MISALSTMRHRLRMRHLHLIQALSACSSLRQAAEELAMTQPAATKALQEMEDILGVALFVRHSRGMEATIYGEAVTRYAKLVFADMEALHDELVGIDAGDMGKVRVGAVMAPAPDLLTRAIVALKASHPRLHITVQIDTSDVLVQALQQDQLDMYLGRVPDDMQARDFTFERIGEEHLSIVVGTHHPVVVDATPQAMSSLTGFSWIIQPHPSPMRQIIDQTFRETRVAPPVSTIETSSILTTLSLLRDSDMVAVLPTSVARYYADLKMIAIVPAVLVGTLAPYGLVMRSNRRITPACQRLIETIQDAASQMDLS